MDRLRQEINSGLVMLLRILFLLCEFLFLDLFCGFVYILGCFQQVLNIVLMDALTCILCLRR